MRCGTDEVVVVLVTPATRSLARDLAVTMPNQPRRIDRQQAYAELPEPSNSVLIALQSKIGSTTTSKDER
jgi:hypothetical protein